MELSRSESLLAFCQTEKMYGEIKSGLDLPDGAVYSMLQRLVARGLLRKVREGAYQATAKGIEHLRKMTARAEKEDANKINFIVSLTVAQKIGRKKNELVDAFLLLRDTLRPDPETQQIRDRIRMIYEDSVPDNDNSAELIRGMWAAHTKRVCKNHFDYESAYKRHVKDDQVSAEIKKYWTEKELFESLHFCSLSGVDRVKRNLKV